MITKGKLKELYGGGLSMMEIAKKMDYSLSGIKYLMDKYNILRRSRNEANYLKYNPNGDPFKIKKLETEEDIRLFNLGIGLFLGEGTKTNKNNVILSNTNSRIVRLFLLFLKKICAVEDRKIKAALNIFNDVSLERAIEFWQKETGISRSRFTKPTIRKSRGGTYKNKSKYGTLSVFVSNTKLKKIIDDYCETALKNYPHNE